ncbi:MAG: CoA transferase [Gammaproteobacteria bacterium]|nr:CoA transferase [Gammaproteobacteria bacterium]
MGVLSGYRVIELAGLGPCPMAGMLLADMGAEVIVIDRGPNTDPMYVKDMSRRGKKSIVVNLKSEQGRNTLLKLVATADVLLEGFRPGVTEKLGIGPDDCFAVNPALVYGRMTGWGQDGPLAHSAGHDINYISLTGALHAIGVAGQKPVVPLNLVGDFGGGTMFLVTGVLGALLEGKSSGKGQVVDAAMIEGAANLMSMCHSFSASKAWDFNRPGTNMLDGGAFYYDTYECADGKYVALGAIERQFFQQFVTLSGVDPAVFTVQARADQQRWPELRAELTRVFATKTRDQWAEIFAGSDACLTPVLSAEEAISHPHNQARGNYQEVDGFQQPTPAPRFSRTPSSVAHGKHEAGADTRAVLKDLGFADDDIQVLLDTGAVS